MRKTPPICLIVLALLLPTVLAEKPTVWGQDKVLEASEEAVREGKGLAFLLTKYELFIDDKSPLMKRAWEELSTHSVVVVLDGPSPDRYDKIPPIAYAGFHQEKGPYSIPRAVLTDPTGVQFWGYLPVTSLKDANRMRDMRKRVEGLLDGTKELGILATLEPDWKTQRGGKVTGHAVAIDPGSNKLTLRKNDDSEQIIPLSKLSENSQAFAKRAIAKLDGSDTTATKQSAGGTITPEVEVEVEYEDWKSFDGVNIHAKFISASGTEVTLQKEGAASPVTFPLSRLSKASRERAAELTGESTSAE